MTKTLTKQTTQVCVLDQQGKPLMPTTRLGKVYRLLKTQKAHIVSYEPFTIQLDYEPDTHIIQPMTLGVDSGAIHSGYSVANEHHQLPPTEVGGLFLSSVVERLKADSLPKDSVL